MKRLFGFGKNKKKQRKERLSPSDADVVPSEGFQATSPLYQYARNEFAQTVASGTSNDDGRGVLYISPSDTPSRLFTNTDEDLTRQSLIANAASGHSFSQAWMSPIAAPQNDNDQNKFESSGQDQSQSHPMGNSGVAAAPASSFEPQQQPQPIQTNASGSLISSRSSSLRVGDIQHSQSVTSTSRQRTSTPSSYQPPQVSTSHSPGSRPPNHTPDNNINKINNPASPQPTATSPTPTNNVNIDPDYIAACSASHLGRQESLFSQTSSQYPTIHSGPVPTYLKINQHNNNQYLDYPPSWELPDATYEEEYGDAYIGGPIRYIYPSGYQSMRPRSGPWKLSIIICMLFTWLSVFIVGHCSDRVDSDVSQYNQNEIDDDTLVIETRWCGSRLLYMMWVISMLVTGLAAAYCSIIGYIKVRDFAVANSRSQPPGMVGKSDFYAQIDDAAAPPIPLSSSHGSFASSGHRNHYHVPIYQADGNPQFWGGHIYRPTQAAVATTSR